MKFLSSLELKRSGFGQYDKSKHWLHDAKSVQWVTFDSDLQNYLDLNHLAVDIETVISSNNMNIFHINFQTY